MRIAVSAQGKNLNAEVDPRFGRTSKFIIVDSETMDFQVIENSQNLNLPQGAGIQAAQNVIPHNPDVVLTGNCGPKAYKVLEAAKVPVIVGVKGTIRKAVQEYLDGHYEAAGGANVEGHWM
jgi:predicted Fe-Mo cluster-binding NifX family protein